MGLIILSPLFLLIAVLIRLDSPGSIFFRQDRAGKNGETFRIFKFRSMTVAEQPQKGFQKNSDPRITRVGHWLRRLSLDELPQFINVVRGDMSLIGPRPALPYQIERYDKEQWQRLAVRPGITGWAQVNGRNALSWEEKMEFDVYYVNHCSFRLDTRIVLKTFNAIVDGSGVYFHGKSNAWQSSKGKSKQI